MSAIISPCGNYRYRLERKLGKGRTCLFLMLNPSTADADTDDATLRRCMGFATSWGYGRLLVGNLFAFRTKKPSLLKKAKDPIGPDNFTHLREMCDEAHICIAAWGSHGKFRDQDKAVLKKLEKWGIAVHFLKVTKHGHPCHPLYLSSDLKPRCWDRRDHA